MVVDKSTETHKDTLLENISFCCRIKEKHRGNPMKKQSIYKKRTTNPRKKRLITGGTILLCLALLLVAPKLWQSIQASPAWNNKVSDAGTEVPGNSSQALSPDSSVSPEPTVASSLSPSSTATPTPSPSLTATPTPSPSPTPTLTPTPTSTPSPSPTLTPTPTPSPTPVPEIVDKVRAALLIDCESGSTIYGYQEQEILAPASVTKLMTALLAFEYGKMEDILVPTAEALNIEVSGAVICGLKQGDKVPLKEAMHGLLLPSGNEVANVIAEYIGGDLESFVALMNARAAELGMKDTCFKNAHGLPDEEHLTTAQDISLLMKELLPYEEFFEIAGKGSYEIRYTNKDDLLVFYTINNTNHYLNGKREIPEGIEILGGKTGYTVAAGRCLVMYVKTPDGKVYIAEIFGAQDYEVLYDAMNALLEMLLCPSMV